MESLLRVILHLVAMRCVTIRYPGRPGMYPGQAFPSDINERSFVATAGARQNNQNETVRIRTRNSHR